MEHTLTKGSWYAGIALAALGLFFGASLVARADTGSVSNVVVTPSSNTAVITWNTSTNANSQVSYGSSNVYSTQTALDSSLGMTHTVTLTGLSPNTTYHFSVLSSDSNNGMASSTDQTFTTTGSGSTSNGSSNSGSGVASVTLNSPSGGVGSQLSFSGSGFVPYESVTVNFNGSNMTTLTADASGNVSSSISIPSGTAVGNTSLRLSGVSSSRLASAGFTVNASANASTGSDMQALSNLVAQLQTEITSLLSRISALEAQVNVNVSGGSSGSLSGSVSSSNHGNGVPAGDRLYVGTISAVGNGSFTLKQANGNSYTVNVASGATVWNKNRVSVPWASYKNGDSIRLDASGSETLNADVLRDMSI
ncbi:MAG: fibronectin type III domain-containing protein [Patescibacteria group bacterium]|nr:fibronectin type III domain-containing protein [Patescibacteria group bacterium]